MKKYLLVAVAIISLISLRPINVSAISGACSYHSGVNCSAGPSATGNITCNDGWVNSSVLFSNTDECNVDTCPQIVSLSCMTESDYTDVQQEVNNTIGSNRALEYASGLQNSDFGTGMENNINNAGQAKLDNCRNEINLYNNEVTARQQCETARQTQQSQAIANQAKLNADAQRQSFIDQAFQKYFSLAMQDLPPEYKNIVDPDLIKKLSLDPANQNETFEQLIIETYSKDIPTSNTQSTVVTDTGNDTSSTPSNPFSDILQKKPAPTKLKQLSPAISTKPAPPTKNDNTVSTEITTPTTTTPIATNLPQPKITFTQRVVSFLKHLKFW